MASLLTQASYALTFLSSTGFPDNVVATLQEAMEELMNATSSMIEGDYLPDLEKLSERLCATSFNSGVLVYETLVTARKQLTHKMILEPVLSEAGQRVLQSVRRTRLTVLEGDTSGNQAASSLTTDHNLQYTWETDETLDHDLRVAVNTVMAISETSRQTQALAAAGYQPDHVLTFSYNRKGVWKETGWMEMFF